jgi:small nuclear ribonucleoprotein (snRNP)-like protein
MEYLTVKDVAALVRRNEETIRRMIRARKLDVELSNNNRHQGYMISVDQLVNTWDIKREDVEKYIESQKRLSEEQKTDERIPLGPKRKPIDMAYEIEHSAHVIAQEINRLAALSGAGEENAMSDEYKRNNDENNQNGDSHEYFSADFSAVGERVSEIIGDAYRQVHKALNQASAACDAARKQAAERAESARQAQQAHAEDAAEAAEHAKEALNARSAAIRDAIANACAKTRNAAHATGGWAENIRPMRKAVDDEQPEQSEENVIYRDEVETDEEEIHAPEFVPEFQVGYDEKQDSEEKQEKSEYIPVGKNAMDEENNASYQMLQAARRAVEARKQAATAESEESQYVRMDTTFAEFADKRQVQQEQPEDAAQAETAAEIEITAEPETAVEPKEPEAAEATATPEEPEAPAQPEQPEQDKDALNKRIDNLEEQLSRLNKQLEMLTEKLLRG